MMQLPSHSRRAAVSALFASLILTLTVCDSRDPAAPETGSGELVVRVVSGDAQRAQFGTELPNPIVIQALDKKGKPIKDQLVNFRVIEGGGSMYAGASTTNKDGIAQDYWTLGPTLGLNRLEVRAVDPTTGEKLVFATLTATATPVPVATVTLQFIPYPITLEIDEYMQLEPVVRDAAGNVLTDRLVTFSSSNSSIASVDEGGLVKGVAPGGPVTITATSEGKSATVQVTVVKPRVYWVMVTPAPAEMAVGSTMQFYGIPLDRNGQQLDRPVTWSSSDVAIATVSSAGVVTAVGSGSAIIYAHSADGAWGGAQLTVSERVTSITLTPASQTLVYGGYGEILAELRSATGQLVTNRTILWTSSDPDVVAVSSLGDMKGYLSNWQMGGPVTITATVDGVSATATVTIRTANPDPFEPNNSLAAAFELTAIGDTDVPVVANGWMHYEGDEDWFKILARETSGGSCFPGTQQRFRVRVALTNMADVDDYDLSVYGGDWVASSGNGGNADEIINREIIGTCGIDDQFEFSVRVFNYSRSINENPYRLSVSLLKL